MALFPDVEDFLAAIRPMIRPSFRPWVLFRHGTLVGLLSPETDPSLSAIDLIGRFGPVRPGSPGGDFVVHRSRDMAWPGWLVSYDHGQIATVVLTEELPETEQSTVKIGLFGRSKRALDAATPEVVHIARADGP